MYTIMKITDVDESVLNINLFENKKSFDYFIKGFRFLKKMQELKDSGNLIFVNDELIKSKEYFSISFENGIFPSIGLQDNYSHTSYLGDTYGNKDDTIFVYAEELKIFKKFSYVNKSNIKNVEL